MKTNTRLITGLALLAAMSIILVSIPLLRFPLIPIAPYLEYDAADIPIMIGTFLYGPLAGVILTIIVCLFQGITVSAASGPYGILMHIIATCTFAIIAGNIYKKNRNLSGALLGLSIGALSSVVIMIPANLIITPLFLGASISAVRNLLMPAIIPFNLIKFGINSAACFLLYKRMHKAFDYIMNNYKNPFSLHSKNKISEPTNNVDSENNSDKLI